MPDRPDASVANQTSLSLLERARSQDDGAWHRLVDLYGPLIYHWAIAAGLQPADAEDVGQQVFESVASHLGDFHRDQAGDSFRGWLRSITRNKILDHQRKLARQNRAPVSPTNQIHDAEEPVLLGAEGNWLCQRAIRLLRDQFEEKTFQAFWQQAVLGRTPTDVAADLDLSLNAVYLAKSRVLGRLRAEFAELLDEGAKRQKANHE